MRRRLGLATAIILALAIDGDAIALEATECQPERTAWLDQAGIDPANVMGTTHLASFVGGGEQSAMSGGHEFWIRLKACTGYLFLEMTSQCLPVRAYTRGNCTVEGLDRY